MTLLWNYFQSENDSVCSRHGCLLFLRFILYLSAPRLRLLTHWVIDFTKSPSTSFVGLKTIVTENLTKVLPNVERICDFVHITSSACVTYHLRHKIGILFRMSKFVFYIATCSFISHHHVLWTKFSLFISSCPNRCQCIIITHFRHVYM